MPEVTPVFTILRLWEVTPTRWTNNRLSLAEIPRPLRDIQVLNTISWRFLVHWRTPEYSAWTSSRGPLLLLTVTQVLKLNTPQATPLLREAVQVLKKVMDSQTRPVIPRLEFLPTLQDRLPLTPVPIITDRDSKGRSQPPKIRVFRVTRRAITRHLSFID